MTPVSRLRLPRFRVLGATALVSAALSVGVLSGPASAAPCPAQKVQNYTRVANAVFVGTVEDSISSPRTDGLRGEIYTQPVSVTRVYQGKVTSDEVTVQTDRIPKMCTVGPLVVGSSYVFFVQGDGEPWIAVGGGGTTASTEKLVAQVERLLGSGRVPVAPAKESATFTPLTVDPPARLSRAAAPGAALVIIGLLGMLVAGRFGRRTV